VVAIESRSVLVKLVPVVGLGNLGEGRASGPSHMTGIRRGFSAALGDVAEQVAFGPEAFSL
jgi:hypothetical protein